MRGGGEEEGVGGRCRRSWRVIERGFRLGVLGVYVMVRAYTNGNGAVMRATIYDPVLQRWVNHRATSNRGRK